MKSSTAVALIVSMFVAVGCAGKDESSGAASEGALLSATQPSGNAARVIGLWSSDRTAFGMYVPSEQPPGARDSAGNRLPPLYTADGAQKLASAELIDFLFLNLEGAYDSEAVRTMVAGLASKSADARPTLIVRLPTIEAAGADSTRARVAQVLSLGADGVVIPHVRSAEEARLAVSFFADARANAWSPANPTGTTIAMLMVEDGGAIAALDSIVAVSGYSMLSCGIGSLTRAMEGDRDGAEAACLRVREAATARGMPSMMTAVEASLADRISRGYLGILLSGTIEDAQALTRTGLQLSGRSTPQ